MVNYDWDLGHKVDLIRNATLCVTAKRKERRKAKGKTRKETRKEEGHLERKPLEGDTLKLTEGEATRKRTN